MRSSTFQRTTVDGIDLITILRPGIHKTVMLLHGFGASGDDLAPLADYLDRNQEWNWIFPEAILEVPTSPHTTGRAWFPIRMAEIEAAAMRGETVDFADVLPQGMKNAEARIISLIEKLRIEPRNLVLGGFSQGAMMAVQVAITLKEDLRGLVLFSGTFINRNEWVEKLSAKRHIPYIQSHGKNDPILGFDHAVRLNSQLKESGLKGDFLEFSGGHEIPLPIIQKAANFLTGL